MDYLDVPLAQSDAGPVMADSSSAVACPTEESVLLVAEQLSRSPGYCAAFALQLRYDEETGECIPALCIGRFGSFRMSKNLRCIWLD